MRSLRAAVRLAAVLLLVLFGVAAALALFPWLSQRRRSPWLRRWARAALRCCGVRLQVAGTSGLGASGDRLPSATGQLLLANHISWLDVFAIGAVLPIRFVAKAEIRRWPLVGWLASQAGTLYIERGRRHAVAAMNHRVRDLLETGEIVAVFPEGTTTDGSYLLPFHSNLIAPALEVGCRIQPAALRYTQQGHASTETAFIGETTLAESLWRTLRASDLQVELALLPPVLAVPGQSRHEIAAAARQAIAACLGIPSSLPRGTGGTDDSQPGT
jgi:1-acyl-sn-glycerol-3-phosphate acyltransferase